MTFGAVFPRVLRPPFGPVPAPAAGGVDWSAWFDHFWQAKGAASQAASYLDLVGSADLTEGVAPTWSSGAGWSFDGSTQYLTTGIIPAGNQTWSMLIACTSGHIAAGIVDGYKKFMLWTRTDYGGQRIASNGDGDYGWIGGMPTAPFVFGFAGRDAYYNGVDEGDILDEADTTYAQAITIGIINTIGWAAAGTITAVGIKASTMSSGDVAAASAAMAAL